ncbi:MAG: hypothetical protein ACE37B_19895 [Ilumatobacter sp.]|uniref:hypothetical protein n=1 Tax=Ilumatobacter sp. TaxID=1967498 RepID=UPI00391C1B96
MSSPAGACCTCHHAPPPALDGERATADEGEVTDDRAHGCTTISLVRAVERAMVLAWLR